MCWQDYVLGRSWVLQPSAAVATTPVPAAPAQLLLHKHIKDMHLRVVLPKAAHEGTALTGVFTSDEPLLLS